MLFAPLKILMIEYFIKRVATLFFTLLFASIVIFVSLEIIPGDPASYMLGINAQEDTLLALKKELGLDKPKFERYVLWVKGMLIGDFGVSYTYRSPVIEMVAERLWVSLPLAIYALLLSTIINLAPQFSIPYLSSSLVHQLLRGTAIAPIEVMAIKL